MVRPSIQLKVRLRSRAPACHAPGQREPRPAGPGRGGHTYRVIGRKAQGFLRWRSWGGAERRALLLHGSTSSSATWWQVGPALAEAGWRVKAPDLPSHGASPRAGRAADPGCRRPLGGPRAGRPPHRLVVGHSFGAAVALALLDGAGDRSLVLEELPGPQSVDWDGRGRGGAAGVAAARRDPRAVRGQTRRPAPLVRRGLPAGGGGPGQRGAEEIAAGLRQGGRLADSSRRSSRAGPMHGHRRRRAPGQHGSAEGGDATALRGSDRAAARLIADAFVELDGGHCLHRDQPDDWLRDRHRVHRLSSDG